MVTGEEWLRERYIYCSCGKERRVRKAIRERERMCEIVRKRARVFCQRERRRKGGEDKYKQEGKTRRESVGGGGKMKDEGEKKDLIFLQGGRKWEKGGCLEQNYRL